MKDAKGHGSDAHSAGIEQVGRTPLNPTPYTRGVTAAGRFVIGQKEPSAMTNGQIAKEYENLTLHSSAVGRDMINTGRGMEKPSDRVGKTDDLSMMDRALNQRISELQDEHHYRTTMGGRRVQSEDGRVKFVGKQPGSLKRGYFP